MHGWLRPGLWPWEARNPRHDRRTPSRLRRAHSSGLRSRASIPGLVGGLVRFHHRRRRLRLPLLRCDRLPRGPGGGRCAGRRRDRPVVRASLDHEDVENSKKPENAHDQRVWRIGMTGFDIQRLLGQCSCGIGGEKRISYWVVLIPAAAILLGALVFEVLSRCRPRAAESRETVERSLPRPFHRRHVHAVSVHLDSSMQIAGTKPPRARTWS